MSTPWGDDPQRSQPLSGGQYGSGQYGSEQYGGDRYGGQQDAGGPVDPYAGQASAPVPAYNPYANPGSWEPARYLQRPTVPGTVIAGSIVGYLFALLLFVSGLFLVFFGTVVPDSFDEADSTLGNGGVSLLLAGFGNWIAVALLVTSGVLVTVRRPAGLIVTVVSASLVFLLAVYWVVLYPGGGVVFWAVVHLLFALVSALLILLPPGNRAWLARRPGSDPAPAPAGPPPYPTDQYGRPFGS